MRPFSDLSAVLGPRLAPAGSSPPGEAGGCDPDGLTVRHASGPGATNAEAAEQLHVSEATVKTHLGSLLGKPGPRDRAAAIVFAHDQRLV